MSSSSSGGGLVEPLVLTQSLTLPGGAVLSAAAGAATFSGALTAGGAITAAHFQDSSAQIRLTSAQNQGSATIQAGLIAGTMTDQANAIAIDIGVVSALASTNLNTIDLLRVAYGITGSGGGTANFKVKANGKPIIAFTDTSGTPGAATINTPTGRAAIAAAASSVVVTSSCVSATSIVLPILETADSTLTRISVAPGAGSFTVTGNAAATGTTKFSFVVLNS